MDIKLIQNIMEEVRDNKDLLDSFSPNQFKSKLTLINHIKSLNILNKNSEVVIFGSWYGSILVPALYDEVKKITCIDEDKKVTSKAKYKIFKDYNVEWISDDVFSTFRDQYKTTDLFINTSCEHMRPMRDWGPIGPRSRYKYNLNYVKKFGVPQTYKEPWWDRVSPTHFAFTSNNMYDIEGHINCVNNMEQFKKQLPDKAKVLVEDEVKDERGTRFLLVGKI